MRPPWDLGSVGLRRFILFDAVAHGSDGDLRIGNTDAIASDRRLDKLTPPVSSKIVGPMALALVRVSWPPVG
jgi:hypothetical protein